VLNRSERIRKDSYGWYHGSFAFRPMSRFGRDERLFHLSQRGDKERMIVGC
jgi:hypothetical protein